MDGLMGSPEDRYLLVDGNNLLARAAHAARGRGVTLSAHGVDTSALLLFVNMLSKFVRRAQPTHVSVYWDLGHSFRDRIYPAYKANREQGSGMKDSLPMEQAKQFLTWAGVPHRSGPAGRPTT
jgi:5'-3' exonuclease